MKLLQRITSRARGLMRIAVERLGPPATHRLAADAEEVAVVVRRSSAAPLTAHEATGKDVIETAKSSARRTDPAASDDGGWEPF
jgi:hypothetical protein